MQDYKVALIVLYDSENRFLLQHRSKDAWLLADNWAFFGGGLRENEEPIEALRREVKEELDYMVDNPKLILEQFFRQGQIKGYMYVYAEEFTKDKGLLKLNEGQGWGWFKEAEISKLKITQRDKKIINFITRYLEDATVK